MTVNEIKPNTLCLEYRQEKGDKDYGSCLWARFMFNLDRYELTITSDCGNYGYKWCESTKESFLELMARCDYGYMLDKLYGRANIFDYEATKKHIYEILGNYDDDDKEKLDEIFDECECYGEPESAEEFLQVFGRNNDGYFTDMWEYVQYDYPANALKIVQVFEDCIRPKIREFLKRVGE